MTMLLRDYQEDSLARVEAEFTTGARGVVLVAPTGAGKTVMFVSAAQRHLDRSSENRVLTVVHREELLRQATGKFRAHGIPVGECSAGTPRGEGRAWVTTIGSVSHALEQIKPTMVVWDECHHVVCNTWMTLRDHLASAIHLGVTATPERLDGKPLGDAFDAMVISRTVRQLTLDGHLAQTRIYAPRSPSKEWAQDPVSEYLARGRGTKAIAFFKNRRESIAAALAFCERGVRAEHVDGTSKDRQGFTERFASGETRVLCNVALFSEGVDVPSCKCIIFAKRVLSQTSWLQGCGRAMRPDGVEEAAILDLCGSVWLHGSPSLERTYSLEKGIQIKGKTLLPTRCTSCTARLFPGEISCPNCLAPIVSGTELAVPKEPTRVEARDTADCTDASPIVHDEVLFKKLVIQARMLKFKPGWVWFQYKEKIGDNPPRHFMRFLSGGGAMPSSKAKKKKSEKDDLDL